MIQDESGRIHSTYTDWDVTITEPWNRSKDYIMVLDHNAEIVSQTRIWHDTTHAFGYSGLLYDEGDDTHVLYGSWRDSAMYFANSFPDAFLSKVAADGEILWEKHYPNTFGVWHVVKAMDGGYWIMGNEWNGQCDFNSLEINDDLIIIKADAEGIEESRLVLGGPCGNEAGMLVELAPGQVALGARFTFEEQDNNWEFHGSVISTLIQQTEDNGPLQEISGARKTYLPCQTIGYLADFHQVEDGYLLVGYTGSQPVFNEDLQQRGYILKVDENRDSLWARFYSVYDTYSPNGRPLHWLWDSKLTLDGGVVCCGEVLQFNNDPTPLLITPWLFKTDSLGCIEPGCQFVHVEEITIGLEQSMSVFPNPASHRATVRFDLPADFSIPDHSQWVMIDLQGREIMREDLSRSAIQSGDIPLDLSSIAPGIYQIHWIMDSVWLD
ncbi:MAG: hypothetical protein ACK58T_47190, partial [Phycisphaerae bacterium]